ncbi:helix-turn-helix domain-containing protein [Luteipulveratus mongoliensis]|uniref:HTH araC/xylS-type domain-containing protein n=1 Tax=Luteipulveratus mongoliensis TaxID=571913 RepID=A0A0K1JH39_9MICO|nr:AraC family transcriptional regulator [Luteipulveratus mongoliensis]AKU15905.1 hypothetical protein VV02_08645 [Luteipulveratus mongoliensis]
MTPAASSWSSYLTPGAQHRRLGLTCLGVGEQSGPVEPVRARSLDSYALVLIEQGQGWLEYDGRRHAVRAPFAFWLAPGVPHSYGPDTHGWAERWVLFDGKDAQAYAALGVLDARRPATPVEPTQLIQELTLLRQLCARTDQPHRDAMAGAQTHRVVVAAAQARDRVIEAPYALGRLTANAARAWSVEDHARAAGLTLRELRTAVRRGAGCTPQQFVVQARMSAAKSLLAETDLTVAAIAARVGYEDPAYFSRLFSRQIGLPPSAFREQQQRGRPPRGDDETPPDP